MKKVNNKGQVLVCFVLLIPIIFMIFSIVINIGFLSIEKRNISNSIKEAINYGLKHIDDNNIEGTLRELIKQNIDNLNNDDININIDNSYIKIKISKNYQGIFKYVNYKKITICYYGNISDEGITIKKEE